LRLSPPVKRREAQLRVRLRAASVAPRPLRATLPTRAIIPDLTERFTHGNVLLLNVRNGHDPRKTAQAHTADDDPAV